jgi:MYXO-CTERM domain-containing protein
MMFTADSIRTNPNYMGGDIGFALKGKAGTSCPQTHFSEQRLNIACTAQGCQAGDHWIAAIIYQSQTIPNAYYIAFEDVAMSPDSFAGPGPFHNDGDFNDFVYFVEGITCDGGGVPCDTGMLGVCGPGLTECQPDGTIACRPQIEASPEKCDAIDNDCNGMVDDGDLCLADEICLRGKCEHFCNNAEFPCPNNFTCIDKVCIENSCLENTPPTPKVCPEGKICKGGNCVGVCDGVICPVGQNCEVGVCLDPCDGVTCGTDEVCTGGVCVLNCNCRPCSGTDVCNTTSGQCVKPACATAACTAPQVCDPNTGACVDPCMGAVCPGGAMCTAGKCGEPVMVTMTAPDPAMLPGGGGLTDPSVDTPAVINPSGGAAGSGSTASSGAGGSAGSGTTSTPRPIFAPTAPVKSGCGCSLPGSSNSSSPWALLLGLGLFGLRRRTNRCV